jgi:hypothetical protein
MKQFTRLKERGKGYIDAILRFPLMIVLLITAVITNAISIHQDYDENHVKLLVTFLLGACIYAVSQMLYERFSNKSISRYLYMIGTLILTFLYYLYIKDAGWSVEITIRTTVIFFLLFIAFLWIPVIQSRYNFNDSFMAVFKAFFVTIFFYGILFLGLTLVYGAADLLITDINEKVYMHTANIIFILIAPIHFLSLIPYYPHRQLKEEKAANDLENPEVQADRMGVGESEIYVEESGANESKLEVIEGYKPLNIKSTEEHQKEEALLKLITPVKFLEALVSYVVIPITAVFTFILLIYIIRNIAGNFWTDNLMEPLLVSYSITVIIVYLLSSTMNNQFTKCFRKIFPKVLLPVVVFQTIASILKINEAGIGYGRYYVILFGIFATVSGILFCFKPVQKNGTIAPILILLSLISILPGVGAFTVSRINQTGRLEQVLERNNMLQEDAVIPDSTISDEDKQMIIQSVDYLDTMEYSKDIAWLKDYSETGDFERTFGFARYLQTENNNRYIMITRNQSSPIPVIGYDYMVRMNLYGYNTGVLAQDFEKGGKTYHLTLEGSYKEGYDIVLSEADTELIRFPMNEIYDKFTTNNEKTSVDTSEVTFTKENDKAALTIVAETISINEWEDGKDREAEIYVLVSIK